MTKRLSSGKDRWFISSIPDAELLNMSDVDGVPVVGNADGVAPMTEITDLIAQPVIEFP